MLHATGDAESSGGAEPRGGGRVWGVQAGRRGGRRALVASRLDAERPQATASGRESGVGRPRLDLEDAERQASLAGFVPVPQLRLRTRRSRRGRKPRYLSRSCPKREYGALVEEVESMLQQGWAESTARGAESARRSWEAFADEYAAERPVMIWGPGPLGLSMRASLHNEVSLMLFAAWLVDIGLAASTASSYLSLVRSTMETEYGWRLTVGAGTVRLPRLLRRLRRMFAVVRRKRLGWRARHQRMFAAARGPPTTHRHFTEDAVLCLAREGLTRCCELGPRSADEFDGDVHPTVGDVTFFDDGPDPYLTVMVMPAKKGPGQPKIPVPCPASAAAGTSAYAAISQMLAQRRRGVTGELQPEAPLFVDANGIALTKGAMVTFFRDAALLIGLDGAPVSGHSGRIGGATDHFASGTPPSVLQICGRWASDLWQIYARQCIDQTLGYTAAASRCDDVSLEEVIEEYTEPATMTRSRCPAPSARLSRVTHTRKTSF